MVRYDCVEDFVGAVSCFGHIVASDVEFVQAFIRSEILNRCFIQWVYREIPNLDSVSSEGFPERGIDTSRLHLDVKMDKGSQIRCRQS